MVLQTSAAEPLSRRERRRTQCRAPTARQANRSNRPIGKRPETIPDSDTAPCSSLSSHSLEKALQRYSHPPPASYGYVQIDTDMSTYVRICTDTHPSQPSRRVDLPPSIARRHSARQPIPLASSTAPQPLVTSTSRFDQSSLIEQRPIHLPTSLPLTAYYHIYIGRCR